MGSRDNSDPTKDKMQCRQRSESENVVTTDMTTLPPDTPNEEVSKRLEAAAEELAAEDVSTNHREAMSSRQLSRQSTEGPGWRANVRGDYDTETLRPIATKDLICWAYQISRGMDYLAKQRVMHGALACRNVLLADDNIIKICDFGLAKDIYKTDTYRKKTDGPLPVKWMAVESLQDRIFSTQSDVWSFGIVLWEIFSLGKTPYPGMVPNEVFYTRLVDGYRMEKPPFCPNSIYSIMLKCWDSKPEKRPHFSKITEDFEHFLEEGDQNQYLRIHGKFEDASQRPLTAQPQKHSIIEMVKRSSSNLLKGHDGKHSFDRGTLINNPVYSAKPTGLLQGMGDIDISRQLSSDELEMPCVPPGK